MWVWAAFFLVACSSIRGPEPSPEGVPSDLDRPDVLPLASTDIAAALAAYGNGLLAESNMANEEALRHYLEAVEKAPHELDPYRKAISRLLVLNRPDDALELIRLAEAAIPSDPAPMQWEASLLYELKRHEDAFAVWKKLLGRFPKNRNLPLEAAQFLFQTGQEKDAIDLLKSRLKSFDYPEDYYRYLANLYPVAAKKSDKRSLLDAEASELLRAAIHRYPNEPLFHTQLADILIRQDDLPAAFQHLDIVENGYPDDPNLKARLAIVILQAYGDVNRAIEALQTIAENPASSSRVSMYLGILLEAQGNARGARHAYERATLRQPEEATPFWKIASLAFANNVGEARKILEEAYERFPDKVILLELLANARLQTGDARGSVTLFRQLAPQLQGADESEPILRFFLQYALAALLDGDPLEAADALVRVMHKDPSLMGTFTLEAIRTRDPAVISNACETAESLQRDFPESPALYIHKGLLEFMARRYDLAVNSFRHAEDLNDHLGDKKETLTSRFYYRYGAAAEQIKDYTLAEAKLQEAIRMDPEAPEPLNHLAYMWAERGVHLEEALSLSEKSLRLEPLNPAYLDTRGWIQYRLGNTDKAIEDLLIAVSLLPDDATLLEHLGDALAVANRLTEAEDAYRMAVEIEDEETIEGVREKHRALLSRIRQAQEERPGTSLPQTPGLNETQEKESPEISSP